MLLNDPGHDTCTGIWVDTVGFLLRADRGIVVTCRLDPVVAKCRMDVAKQRSTNLQYNYNTQWLSLG